MNDSSLHLCLVAGEHSGDRIGADLMQALIRQSGGRIRFSGLGGEEMIAAGAAQGFRPWFPMQDVAVAGIVEILPHLPRLFLRLRESLARIREDRPDMLVTIDAPGFSFALGKRLVGSGIPHVHFVAPTVWAWRPGRARTISRFLDHLLMIFPFEAPYFERWGLGCSFVGHPVMERGLERGDGMAFRKRHGIPAGAPLLCLLPGSRQGEVSRLLPVFAETVTRLGRRFPDLQIVIPTVPSVDAHVRAAVSGWSNAPILVEDSQQKADVFAAADLALAASGTVTYELAAAGLPMVVAYRVAPVTALILRVLLKVRYASVVNLILSRPVVPEFIQGRCRADLLETAVGDLLSDPEARNRQKDALRDVALALGQGGAPTSQRAASILLDLIRKARDETREKADEEGQKPAGTA